VPPINPEKINTFIILPEYKFFFDTNILIFLFAPLSNISIGKKIKNYSELFEKTIESKNVLYVSNYVISEFINTISKMKYKSDFTKYINFKEFRNSNDYSVFYKDDIKPKLLNIYNTFKIVPDAFESKKFKNLLNDLEACKFDYNDYWIAQTSRKHNCYLVTDDHDFSNGNIDDLRILTS